MEKRVLLAVFLSFLVLYAYQTLFVKPAPKAPVPVPTTASQATATPVAEPPAEATSQPIPQPPGPASVQTLVAEETTQETVVETDVVRAVFSNRGATLTSWKLKKFLDDRKQPLELVPANLPGDHDRPFSLDVGNPQLTERLNDALFRRLGPDAAIDARQRQATLAFEYQDAGGLHARKTFTFEPQSYVVALTATVSDGDQTINPAVNWGPALGDAAGAGESNRYIQKPEGILFLNGKVERLGVGALAKQSVYTGEGRFAGVDDHYFLSAAVSPGSLTVEYKPILVPATPPATPHELVAYSTKYARPISPIRFFVGPKDFDVLAAVDRDLVRVINFGWFSWLVVPLLRSLKWINAYVGNYGWSIIILTIVINAVMFPLRHKSVVSMRKMQELQPEVKAIQDRYAKFKTTDPERQKMNTELMNLYRERGVNPASGCVPMVLTMPVLFAFYSLLSQSIEIRGAHFMGWIRDLSLHDPLYVTPILMGITMVVQQKMTPSTADPAQQRMMMFMPLVFTFMFLWAPSGLVLYWLVSNLWAIGQQHVTNRLIGPPAVRTVRPAAERRVKKLSGAK